MRCRTERTVTYRAHDREGPVPALILQGRFLERFGFTLGSRFKVAYAPGAITIQAMDTLLLNEHQQSNVSLLTRDIVMRLRRGDWTRTPSSIMRCVTCGRHRITTPIMHFFRFDGRRFQCYPCQRSGLKANV